MRYSEHFTKDNNLIFEKALKNCHVTGLHGIVFNQEGDYLRRMFIADEDHVLWYNSCSRELPNWDPLSLAIHPHRIDIEIQVITGTIYNVQFFRNKGEENLNENSTTQIDSFKWNSHILNNAEKPGGFENLGKEKIIRGMVRKLTPGEKVKMRSDYLHTVYVEKGETASWFITESEPTGGYDGVVFGNTDLTKWTAQNLYKKPTEEEVVKYLQIAGIKLKQ